MMCATPTLRHLLRTGDSIAVGAGRPTWEMVSSHNKVLLNDESIATVWQTCAHALLMLLLPIALELLQLMADRCTM
jgi:hypothetical protein